MADENLYTVVPIPDALERMRDWGQPAVRLGLGDWYMRSMRHVDQQLQVRPVPWGDPLFDYHEARLHVFQANHENFIVTYAVHFDRRIVFLRNLELLDGSPLFGRV